MGTLQNFNKLRKEIYDTTQIDQDIRIDGRTIMEDSPI